MEIARRLVAFFFESSAGLERQPVPELRLRIRGGEVVVTPDQVFSGSDGRAVMRRVRTGHKLSKELDSLATAVFHLAADERAAPEEYQKLKREAYVIGAGDPPPAVVTFTTELACVAVNEMIAALTGFHGERGMVPVRFRRFHARDDHFLAVNVKHT